MVQWFRFKINFLFDQSFLCYCSLSIATKGFHGAVSPLFSTAFSRSVSHFSYKKYPTYKKSTFLHLFNSIFFSEFHLVPKKAWSHSRTRLTFSQSHHFRKLLTSSQTKRQSNIISFIFKTLILDIRYQSYNLLNLNLRLPQIYVYSFTDSKDCLLSRLPLQ